MRKEIEARSRMDAVDIYGLSEVIGPGISQESVQTKDGLHIWEDHFYPEIIDPLTGEVLPDGEQGELVFTSLTKQAFPVIRYRTKDLTKLLPGTAYPTMRRMEKVTGRTDDMMIIRGVNVFPTQIEELILMEPGLAPYFQCVLTQPGNMVELTVLVETHVHESDEVQELDRRRPQAPDQGPDRHDGDRSRCASRAASSARSARPGASSTCATGPPRGRADSARPRCAARTK